MTTEEAYNRKKAEDPGIDCLTEHMDTLRDLADTCDHVTEFGCRGGFSTMAFLASRAKKVESYDINFHQFLAPTEVAGKWTFHRRSTLTIRALPPTDLLFVDSMHTTAQVRGELRMVGSVRTWLVFHDTVEWGSRDHPLPGKATGHGIVTAIFEFLADHSDEWKVQSHTAVQNGLTILRRRNQW